MDGLPLIFLVYPGMVLFLEEDHYVSDDFLHVLSLVDAERTSRYPNCDIICLGTYLKSYNYKRDQKTVSLSTDHFNIGQTIFPKGMKASCRVCQQKRKHLAIKGHHEWCFLKMIIRDMLVRTSDDCSELLGL